MDSYAQTAAPSLYTIYRGVWTNWSHGPVLGLTLTLSRRDGDLFIAFVALFVTIVGTSFWRISCFVIHSLYSSETAQDGLYHQRQAILRNSANGASGLIRLAQSLWAWRNNARRPLQRLFPLAAFAAFSICAFALASGFSSRVSTGIGNEVLISSSNCAATVAISTNITEQLKTYTPYTTKRMSSYANYAQQCYTNSDTENCNTFVTPRLGVRITRNASCPFSNEMCRSQDGNIFFDTGPLDTHDDLGFNTPESQRFLYRRTTHCAPLVTDGFKNQSNTTFDDASLTTAYMKYFYGPKTSDTNETATYEYPLLWLRQSAARKSLSAAADYSLGSVEAWGINGTTIAGHSSFTPIAPLRRDDADLSLLFLSSNDIGYFTPIDDPWYSAHWLAGHFYVPSAGADALNLAGQMQPYYYRDEPASTLGCVTQSQFCNPRLPPSSQCTNMSGYLDLNAQVRAIAQTDEEVNRLNWFRWAALQDAETLASVPSALGVASLTARNGLNYGMQAALPATQWQLDVEHWHAVSMAALQGRAVDTAVGPTDADLMAEFGVRPNNTQAAALCKSQKILSTAYSNFSIFGIATIFTVGGAIILVSWFLEPVVVLLQRRHREKVYSRLEWCANDTLQLQRLAHEELGLGAWAECDAEVPVTEKGDVLGVLDLEDLRHPRLKAPARGVIQVESPVRSSGERDKEEDGVGSKKPQSQVVAAERDDARSVSSWTEAFRD